VSRCVHGVARFAQVLLDKGMDLVRRDRLKMTRSGWTRLIMPSPKAHLLAVLLDATREPLVLCAKWSTILTRRCQRLREGVNRRERSMRRGSVEALREGVDRRVQAAMRATDPARRRARV